MRQLMTEQLRQLGDTLDDLRHRVRAAVAGEVGRAVAESIREIIGEVLRDRDPSRRRFHEYGPWDDPEPSSHWDQPEEEPSTSNDTVSHLTVALSLGRWWLGRTGSPLSAVALGIIAAGTLFTGGPLARAVISILWSTNRALAATDALGDGARALHRL